MLVDLLFSEVGIGGEREKRQDRKVFQIIGCVLKKEEIKKCKGQK